jgi:hypothetical protein
MNQMALESLLSHKIVKLVFAIAELNAQLTVLWGS